MAAETKGFLSTEGEGGSDSRPEREPFFAVKFGPYSCMCMWQDRRKYGRLASDDGPPVQPPLDMELRENGGRFTHKKAIGQVTFRFPFEWRFLNVIALLYGFLPFAVPFAFFASWAASGHFLFLYGLLLSLTTSVINEVALKPCCNDPRPPESANREQDGTMKPGMPSGHVLNAVTLMVWALMEVLLSGPGVESNPRITWEWVVFIVVLMAPVPWARIYNKDHTPAQCFVAGVLGVFVGMAAYHFRAKVFVHHWKPWTSQLAAAASTLVTSTTGLPTTVAFSPYAAVPVPGAVGMPAAPPPGAGVSTTLAAAAFLPRSTVA